MKSFKKITTKRETVPTAIVPTAGVVKKAKLSTEEPSTKKKQVNPATLPPLIQTVDVATLKSKMLSTTETTKARTVFEEFVNGLDMNEYPGKFDQVSFGDLLHVTPSLPTNKRKLDSLLNIDERVASVYQEAQETYKSLLDKTENAKINDFAKRKKLAQKKPTTTTTKKEHTTNTTDSSTTVEKETTVNLTETQAAPPPPPPVEEKNVPTQENVAPLQEEQVTVAPTEVQ